MKKFLRIIIRILIFVISLEIYLNCGGLVLTLIRDYKNTRNATDGQIRIICIGDSTTYYNNENDYPNQLQTMLDQVNSGKKFRVINKGIPGAKSLDVVQHLEQWLDEGHADVAVIMIGRHDPRSDFIPLPWWYAWGTKMKTAGLLNKLFHSSQDYVLEKYNKFFESSAKFFADRGDVHELKIKADPEKNVIFPATSPEDTKLILQAKFLIEEKKFEQAQEILKYLDTKTYANKSFELKIEDMLGEVEYKKKVGWYVAAPYEEYMEYVRLSSAAIYDERSILNRIHARWCNDEYIEDVEQQLLQLYAKAEDKNKEFIVDFLKTCFDKVGRQNKIIYYYDLVEKIYNKGINPVTQENYKKIIEILQKKNIKMIFMQYPTVDAEELEEILIPISENKSFILIDNKKIFKELLKNNSYKVYFSDDYGGHCTALGNKLIAKDLEKQILKIYN